ncbi:uncharacterized protein LOC110648775 [Hevea brasiliensis]|uniref:uncharacterized protein LOC110648775 n=1 Tax=Hevea brasiliensis TaxID=3981 RepID=UPI0025F4DF46|nr:uncharacterized protein LOC110648775 [Hevea brasiliensis]
MREKMGRCELSGYFPVIQLSDQLSETTIKLKAMKPLRWDKLRFDRIPFGKDDHRTVKITQLYLGTIGSMIVHWHSRPSFQASSSVHELFQKGIVPTVNLMVFKCSGKVSGG